MNRAMVVMTMAMVLILPLILPMPTEQQSRSSSNNNKRNQSTKTRTKRNRREAISFQPTTWRGISCERHPPWWRFRSSCIVVKKSTTKKRMRTGTFFVVGTPLWTYARLGWAVHRCTHSLEPAPPAAECPRTNGGSREVAGVS